MTSPSSSGAAPVPSPAPLSEQLCVSPLYQVVLRTLSPKETLSIPASSDLFRPADCTIWLLSGSARIYQGNTTVSTLSLGHTFDGRIADPASNEMYKLANETTELVRCLEIRRGHFLPTAFSTGVITEERPWGSFTVLGNEPDYKLKRLTVLPGKRLSLQRHRHREEYWMVLGGAACITLNEETVRLNPGDSIRIPLQSWHRIANPLPEPGILSAQPVEILELQLGDYFGEDDIERREDDYGRV